MPVCFCTLARTKACENCPSNTSSVNNYRYGSIPTSGEMVIKKYENGKLVEGAVEMSAVLKTKTITKN